MWMTFLFGNWKVLLIASLSGLLALMTHLYLGERDQKHSVEIELKLKLAALDEQWKRQLVVAEIAQANFDKTLGDINANHQALLVAAEKNAIKNFLAARGFGNSRVHPVSAQAVPATTSADAADGSESLDGATKNLILDCAATTVQVVEWQTWAKRNQLPVESYSSSTSANFSQ